MKTSAKDSFRGASGTAISASLLLVIVCSVPTLSDRIASAENPASAPTPKEVDLLSQLNAINKNTPLPSDEFRSGHAEPIKKILTKTTRTKTGFEIQFPNKSPIPTPTIYRGRLYVSGGFSTKEYYCFDALTGKPIWAVQLDDDGPSSCVPYKDSVLFGCESCTLFALDAETGKVRWAHWLGDPLLSMPSLLKGRVITVYPAEAPEPAKEMIHKNKRVNGNEKKKITVNPTHIIACFNAADGKLLWRRWIDSDCMTAPVAVDNELYLTSLSGNVYRLNLTEGNFLSAHRLRATSAPVISQEGVYVTRRSDSNLTDKIAECVVLRDRKTNRERFATHGFTAPYLDQAIQRGAGFSKKAESFEAPNGIGGGFGGGFGGGSGGGFSVADEILSDKQKPGKQDQSEKDLNTEIPGAKKSDAKKSGPKKTDAAGDTPDNSLLESEPSLEPLAVTQRQAAEVIGLGNVSTLQCFQGSRVLLAGNNLFNCMGNQIVCASASTGKTRWSVPLKGDMKKLGGHLASPPILAGDSLFVTTAQGDILQIDPDTGKIKNRFELGEELRFSPIIHQGRIYVGTQSGKLVCINTGDKNLTGWKMRGRDSGNSNTAQRETRKKRPD